jgi:hypothetical protein
MWAVRGEEGAEEWSESEKDLFGGWAYGFDRWSAMW